MTETAPPVEQKTFSVTVQPGDLTDQLVECREKAGLDIEQAAEELHLSVHILKALEKEDFAHLPEPPYVRGYLRGYAKLADTDSKELIRTYEALRGANPDETAHHFAPARPLNKVAQPAVSASTLKFIGFGALVLLIGLISMIPGVREWANHTWSSFSAQTNPPDVPRPPSAMETYVAQKAAQEREKVQQAEAEQKAKETAAQQAAAQPSSPVAPAATPASTPAATADTASTPAAPTTTPTPASAAASAPAANTSASTPAPVNTADAAVATPATAPTSTDPATVAALADAAQTTGAEVNVKMEFTEDVWAQVKDSDKKALFGSLNTAGSIKEFKAKPPLDFKIGNAPGVKVYVNGKLFDQTPYIKGSVARFKVE